MYFKPEKIIINNPDRLELCRFDLNLIIDEAINVKDNSLTEEYETVILDDVEIIDANNTKVFYSYRKNSVEVSTSIKYNIMEVSFKILTNPNNKESK
jgi:hypothetical protein